MRRHPTLLGRVLRALLFTLLALTVLTITLNALGTTPTEIWHYLRAGPNAPNPLHP